MRHLLSLFLISFVSPLFGAETKPNIIFILSDDLAQGDVGCYGQKLIQTPNLDRMAAEGVRFTQGYCGTTVCAPSRTSLLTGLHSGHAPIRANREIQPEGQKPLPEETVTVAQILQSEGYATACMGKWGMGMFDTSGSPFKKGFDRFYGYNCQRHAHSYFPSYLYDNDRRFELDGNDGKGLGKTYAQELIQQEVERWVRSNKERPFFLYYAITLPHGRHEIDDLGQYAGCPWTPEQKSYAAQVSRLDADIGRLLKLLRELGLDEQTLVMTAGDNGSSFGPDTPVGQLFEQASNGLRGFKRGLYEGALRQAAIARWPGKIPAGQVRHEPWAFWDFLPTAVEIAGAKLPDDFHPDGHSLVSYLRGGASPERDYFYWELHEMQTLQAARWGNWKAVRNGPNAKIEIYDLSQDFAEKTNLAGTASEQVIRAEQIFREAHQSDPDWPLQTQAEAVDAAKKRERNGAR